mmetsp:Transcript_33151/g.98668  ORF Transcript_33151/g.98668 Transcript_33151/m.98668 type:complete len:562 (-) Transcript_33151:439-2124(-)
MPRGASTGGRTTLTGRMPETEARSKVHGGAKKSCMECGVMETPQWRQGPTGPQTLCNACGVRYSRLIRREKCSKGRPAPRSEPVAAHAPAVPPTQQDASDSYTDTSSREDRLTSSSHAHMGGVLGWADDGAATAAPQLPYNCRRRRASRTLRGSSEEPARSHEDAYGFCPGLSGHPGTLMTSAPLPLFKASSSGPASARAPVHSGMLCGTGGSPRSTSAALPVLWHGPSMPGSPSGIVLTRRPELEDMESEAAALSLLRMSSRQACAGPATALTVAALQTSPGSRPTEGLPPVLPPLAAAAAAAGTGSTPCGYSLILPEMPEMPELLAAGLAASPQPAAGASAASSSVSTSGRDVDSQGAGGDVLDTMLAPLLPLLAPEQLRTLRSLCERFDTVRHELAAAQAASEAVARVLLAKKEAARAAGSLVRVATEALSRVTHKLPTLEPEQLVPDLPPLRMPSAGGATCAAAAASAANGPLPLPFSVCVHSSDGGPVAARESPSPANVVTPSASLLGGLSPVSAMTGDGSYTTALLASPACLPHGPTPRCHSAKKSQPPKRARFQ